MKQQCHPKIFIFFSILTIIQFLVYYSIRSMWYGIGRYTAQPVPYILLGIIFVLTLSSVLLIASNCYPRFLLWVLILADAIYLLLNSFVIYVTLSTYMYYIREFFYSAVFLGLIALIYWAINFLHKKKVFHRKWFQPALILFLLSIGIMLQTDVVLFNEIKGAPVVYAVGSDYQIVFTTRSKSTGWILIDGIEYNDTYAGYRKNQTTVHKITVPMDELDEAGEYTIFTRSMMFRGPFTSIQGSTIQKTYEWKGVNPKDGLNYYVISDTHNTQKSPLAAATYFGDSLDFLICCGDTASWLDREEDLTQFLRLAGNITNGAVPVIYARGNHETKGSAASEFYNYVGSNGENFYYTFRLKNVWGVVLDIGEDHGDQYADYKDTARFNSYRQSQTNFLDEILENADQEFDAEGVDYRIAVCHIPLTVKYTNDHAKFYKDTWIKQLNQMKLSILYSGHVHQLWYIDPDFETGSTLTLSPHYSGNAKNTSQRIMTAAEFPSILVSRRSEGQLLTYPEDVFDRHFWGVAATSNGSWTTLRYTNESHEELENITCPWDASINYRSRIILKNIN